MDAQERLLNAAERLVAERGVEVSLREIALSAGQRNNSAVHYHFGSRDGLLQAVLERRNAAMESERLALLAEHEVAGAADGVRELLTILLRPMFTVPYEQGATHYARFLVQVRSHPLIAHAQLSPEHWPAVQILTTRLQRAVAEATGLPPAAVRRRLSSMASVTFALLADAERDRQGATDPEVVDDVISMVVGLLTAVPAGAAVP